MIKKPKEIRLFLPTEEIDCYSVFVRGSKDSIYLEANKISGLGKKLAQHLDNFGFGLADLYMVGDTGHVELAHLGHRWPEFCKLFDAYRKEQEKNKNL